MLDLLAISLLPETLELGQINVQESYIPSGHYIISQKEASKTASITVHDRLERNVSFNSIQTQGGLSFRGLDHKATDFVEDGIPVYRTVNGFTDTRLYMNDVDLDLNDGSGTGSFGVSPMGGEVLLFSKQPTKLFQSKVLTTVTNNDKYLYTNASSKMNHIYIQAEATYYNRSDYELSDDYDRNSIFHKVSCFVIKPTK